MPGPSGSGPIGQRKSTHSEVSAFLKMVGVTGCGCPVDTSVRSTEATTEAAAETLNPWLPLAVP
ncbi:MAG: hypothetical protein IJO73_07770, partial [Clostridia bacterium]|nr:hypothetical protein [Clostridia bacterium]